MSSWALVGFGELASALGGQLARSEHVDEVRVYTRPPGDARGAQALQARLDAVGARTYTSLAGAIRGADVVFAAVPAAAAEEVAAKIAAAADHHFVYVDPTPRLPKEKEEAAQLIGTRGALYVDVAILGTVAADGFAVPMLACGPGAAVWEAEATQAGLIVTLIDGPPGRASLVKLLRSIYMKGRDALIVEMVIAAGHYGLEEAVLESIPASDERLDFPQVANRIICGLAMHAGRRADELAASATVAREASIEATLATAGAHRLRWLAELGLRDYFHRERPTDYRVVLSAIESLHSGPVGP
jgi:3-hydroxyisobutyrate dehydrogenase-like beta-hydroxyacid dehydrogenase